MDRGSVSPASRKNAPYLPIPRPGSEARREFLLLVTELARPRERAVASGYMLQLSALLAYSFAPPARCDAAPSLIGVRQSGATAATAASVWELSLPFTCASGCGGRVPLFASSSQDRGGAVSGASVAALKFYKRFISPLNPPGCRFIPTCSEYGQLAFKQYPPLQALVLTAWRLVRCNPLHLPKCGYGEDLPRWPPPAYWAGTDRIRTVLDDEESRRAAEYGDDAASPLPNGDPLGIYPSSSASSDLRPGDDAEGE